MKKQDMKILSDEEWDDFRAWIDKRREDSTEDFGHSYFLFDLLTQEWTKRRSAERILLRTSDLLSAGNIEEALKILNIHFNQEIALLSLDGTHTEVDKKGNVKIDGYTKNTKVIADKINDLASTLNTLKEGTKDDS
jgi:hypothetical protein